MKHVFLIKPLEKDIHPFVSTIKSIMKGKDYDIHFSRFDGHVSEIIAQYEEKARFYSVGGDGFLNQVIQSLIYTTHELVVIPYGTGNDFSRLINISKDPEEILRMSLNRETIKSDVIKMNERYVINTACFGLDALVANTVHDKKGGYVKSLLRNVVGYPFYEVKLEDEEGILYEGQVTLCVIANGRYYGGGFCIAPDAYINDGYMDIVILPKINKWKAPYYLAKILSKSIHKYKKTFVKKVKACTIYTEGSTNIDGEQYEGNVLRVKIVPQAVNIVL